MDKVTFIVNDKLFRKQIRKIENYVDRKIPKIALKEYKKNTPKDSGNARRKTKLFNRTIRGNYGYAGVLDDGLFPNPPKEGKGKTSGGFSTQAPQGMTKPTVKEIEKQFRAFIKRVR